LAAHSGEKHDWEHILGKHMVGSTFWEKNHDWQHILEKKNVLPTMFFPRMCGQPCFFPECAANHVFFLPECDANHDFFPRILVNNMIGSTFWKKYIIGSKFCGKT
jgi:hypothetical protein